MNGLQLSEQYFHELGLPMLAARFPEYRNRIAAGLVGEGSECFGFDDQLSRDHDWGPAFCLWLRHDDMALFGASLKKEYERLPKVFHGCAVRGESDWGGGRVGVFEIGMFYRRFIGLERIPATPREWRAIPEENLAVATNGKVFMDGAGAFSAIRSALLDYYPEDIRLKKIAARCMSMAQAGQYNFPRCCRRNEAVAAEYAKAQFAADAISMIFLLNKRYKPFYKWMHRALKDLPVLGETVHALLDKLFNRCIPETAKPYAEMACDLMEEICCCIVKELRCQELSSSSDGFLLEHGPQVQLKIEDPTLRMSNVWVE